MTFGWFALLADEYAGLGKHIAGGAGFIANLVIWQEVDYWDVAAKLKPLLHLWSLGIEEQFYLIFPCMLILAQKKRLRLTVVLGVILLASFVCNLYYYQRDPALDFYAPHTRFWELFIGALLAVIAKNNSQQLQKIRLDLDAFLARISFNKKTQNDGSFLSNALSCVGFALILLAITLSRADENYPGLHALLPTIGAALIIAAGPRAWLNRRVLSHKLAAGIGLISYPLYLWHWPIISYFYILNWDDSEPLTRRLIRIGCIIVAILLAFLTYKYIERPIRFKIKKNALKTILLFFIMCCIGSIGLYIYYNNGISNRHADVQLQKIFTGSASGRGSRFSPEEIEIANKYSSKLKNNARYRYIGPSTTVAIIGDSHSESAFFGIATKNAELGINTFGIRYDFRYSLQDRQDVIDILNKKSDIKNVFIFYRGVLYLIGDDIDGYKNYEPALLDKFKTFLQETIDLLNSMDKQVFLVSENPVLSYTPRDYITRPFGYGKKGKPLPPTKQEVFEHQREYLAILDELHGATIIKSIDAFCPGNQPESRCLDFLSDGQVLYYDDDHLSVSGSLFQAETLLAPYLERIAEQSTLTTGK